EVGVVRVGDLHAVEAAVNERLVGSPDGLAPPAVDVPDQGVGDAPGNPVAQVGKICLGQSPDVQSEDARRELPVVLRVDHSVLLEVVCGAARHAVVNGRVAVDGGALYDQIDVRSGCLDERSEEHTSELQ